MGRQPEREADLYQREQQRSQELQKAADSRKHPREFSRHYIDQVRSALFQKKRPLGPQQCAIYLIPQLPAVALLNVHVADGDKTGDQILAKHNEHIRTKHQRKR
ncbi:hypothetical protein D3C73_775930 [compost metagenome]